MNRLGFLGLFLGLLLFNTSCKDEPVIRPTVSIGLAIDTEGDNSTKTLVFSISLSEATSVDYTTTDGTAIAGEDYEMINGTATIAAGMTATTIEVTILSDDEAEQDEQFQVIISNPTNADINQNTGYGTIQNDDVNTNGYTTPDAYDGIIMCQEQIMLK